MATETIKNLCHARHFILRAIIAQTNQLPKYSFHLHSSLRDRHRQRSRLLRAIQNVLTAAISCNTALFLKAFKDRCKFGEIIMSLKRMG